MRTTLKQIHTSTRSRLTAMSVWSRLVSSVPRRTVWRTEQIFWCCWSNSFCLLIARLLSSIDADSFFLNCAQRSSSCVTCSFISWNSLWDVALILSSTLLFKDSSRWCESSRSCKSSYTRWIEILVRNFRPLTRLDKPCVTIQMKAIEQYFHVLLFIMLYKVVQAFTSVWPLKWKLLSSTFMWYCLLCCTRWFSLWSLWMKL